MKILLVQADGTGNPHLGLMYLGGVLKHSGYTDIHHVSLLPSEYGTVEKRNKEYLIELLSEKPEMVCVTTTLLYWNKFLDVCKLIKKYSPDTTLVVGGSGPSVLKEKLLDYPFIDVVCYGEADNTIHKIANTIENNTSLTGINGIIYRENGFAVINNPNPLITDLDSIPFPDRDALNLYSYHSPFTILTSRGCPYNCCYCSKPVHGNKFRARSPLNVVNEIEYLLTTYPDIAKKIKNRITIADDIFNFDINRAKNICDEIISRDLKLNILCTNGFHVKSVDYELMCKMKEAGCSEIWFGVESGNPDILNSIGKGIKLDMVRNAVKLAQQVHIKTIAAHFIIGLPHENIDTVHDSINFAKSLNINVVGFQHANPIIGTKLYDWVLKNGNILIEQEAYTQFNSEPIFETPEFTKEDRIKVHSEAVTYIDSLYRKKAFTPDAIINSLANLKSTDDIKWAIQKLYTYIFKKNLMYKQGALKPSDIGK